MSGADSGGGTVASNGGLPGAPTSDVSWQASSTPSTRRSRPSTHSAARSARPWSRPALAPLRERRAELQARLEGEQRKLVTVLFADLVDFTVLSRTLDAEDVRTLVNEYFARWHALIEANGGVVEKFIGDAVMAVFGLRQSREEDPHLRHPRRARRCATRSMR